MRFTIQLKLLYHVLFEFQLDHHLKLQESFCYYEMQQKQGRPLDLLAIQQEENEGHLLY